MSRNGGFSWGRAEFELLQHISVDSQEDAEEILSLGLRELGSECNVRGKHLHRWWIILNSGGYQPRRACA